MGERDLKKLILSLLVVCVEVRRRMFDTHLRIVQILEKMVKFTFAFK